MTYDSIISGGTVTKLGRRNTQICDARLVLFKTTGSWFGRRRRRRGFPPNRKSYQKKSVSIVNPTPILPAICISFIRNTERGKIGVGFTIDTDFF